MSIWRTVVDFLGHLFNGTKECHRKLDAAIARSQRARTKAMAVCGNADDVWGPSFEAVRRAQEDDPMADVHLPLDATDASGRTTSAPKPEGVADERDQE